MEITEAVSLIEAPKSGVWFARLIEADRQGSSTYYSSEALQRSVGKFTAGTHMYANHLSLTEKKERPEGDVNNLIGVLKEDAVMRPDGIYAPLKIYSDKRKWVEERAGDIGLSIRAEGKISEASGRSELVEITKVHSVDVVTRAGAGGKFVSIMESARPTKDSEAEGLSEAQKEDQIVEFPKELAEALDAQIKAVNALVEGLAKRDKDEADAKAAAIAEAAKNEAPKAPTAGEIAGALREAALSPKAEARVLKAVDGGADLAESIKVEKEIAEEVLAEAAKAGKGGFIDEGKQSLNEAERAKAMVGRVFS